MQAQTHQWTGKWTHCHKYVFLGHYGNDSIALVSSYYADETP